MIEVADGLYVGSDADFRKHLAPLMQGDTFATWAVVHACKEPYHREALGYTGRAAPKDHPEYLLAHRGHRLILNLVDAADPAYIPKPVVDAAIAFMEDMEERKRRVLVHCNQGHSRSPILMLLLLAPLLPADFNEAETQFRGLYPPYAPGTGMRLFAEMYWADYHDRPFGRAA